MPLEQLIKSSKTYSRRYPVVLTRPWDEFLLSACNEKKESTNNESEKRRNSSSSCASSTSASSINGLHLKQSIAATSNTPPPAASSLSVSLMERNNVDDESTSSSDRSRTTNLSTSGGPTETIRGVTTSCESRNFLQSPPSISLADKEIRNPFWLSSSLVSEEKKRITKEKRKTTNDKFRRNTGRGGRRRDAAVDRLISNPEPVFKASKSNNDDESEPESTSKDIAIGEGVFTTDIQSERDEVVSSNVFVTCGRSRESESDYAECLSHAVNCDRNYHGRVRSESHESEDFRPNVKNVSQSSFTKCPLSSRRTMLPRFTCEGEMTVPVSATYLSRENELESSFLPNCDKKAVRRQLLDLCGQKAPKSFEHFFSKTDLDTCKKIGEGTFGEVFSIRRGDRLVAIKVMPIEGRDIINGEEQKSYADMLSELNVTSIHCIYGKYPKRMRDEWDEYDRDNSSENDRSESTFDYREPRDKLQHCILNKKQLFIVLVTEYGGLDLERVKIEEPNRVRSVVWQLCLSVAVAERKLQFEHRDLHLGNVLVRETSEDTLSFRLDGKEHVITTHGIKASIVDYSLSRVTIDGLVFYVNMESEKELFEGTGDAQYDVYRSMREINGNQWRSFNPSTNVDWLKFICSKLIDGKKWQKRDLQTLKELADRIVSCKSAAEIVTSQCE